jgi:hypothetical protein
LLGQCAFVYLACARDDYDWIAVSKSAS